MNRHSIAAMAAVATLLGGCTGAQPDDDRDRVPPVTDLAGVGDPCFPTSGNSGYDVHAYDLKIKYEPQTGRLDGTAAITATASVPLARFHLDLHGLTVHDIKVDNRPAQASRQGDKLIITPPATLPAGHRFVTVVSYGGVPALIEDPQFGSGGFFRTPDGGFAVGQPQSASTWYPVNDHPRDKALYTVDVNVPDGVRAVSNGVPDGSSSRDGWTSWR